MARSLSVGRYKPLSEVVCEKLREAIFRGELRPGQRLVQEDLAAKMGVSRIPVREALHRLAKEGLVELQPHRTAIVRRPTVREVREAFAAVAILERAALELTVKRITDPAIANLERVQAALERCQSRGRSAGLIALNRRFHRALLLACGLPKILDCVEALLRCYPQGCNDAAVSRGRAAMAEHRAILASLKARDLSALQAACARHNSNDAQHVYSLMSALGAPDGRAAG